jgi:signal transduction histidine kinase
VADALPGLEDAQRIAELYYAIDRAANEAISNHRQMQTAVAVQILSRDVTFRLENEVRPLLLRALEVASDDAALIRREAGANRDRLGLFAALVLAGSLVGAGVAGFGLVRASRQADQKRAAHVAAADALRLALEAERALDTERRLDFFADASHELRTPLTILRGEADIGLRGAAGAVRLRQSLERVRTQAEAMSDLLEDLLSLAREDADYRDSAPTDVELDALVDAARDEGSLLADAREVRVIRAGGTDGAILLGRARRLKRALLIGLDNAIKHTPPGGDVRIETALEPDHAIIRIIDAGPGIAEDEKPRLFERFFRGRGEADLENHGLGIGLSIAREIVLSHGGTISLDNGPGQGAILTIALPTVPSQPGVTA